MSVDSEVIDFNYSGNEPQIDWKEIIARMYGLFEEQYRNHRAGSTISKNALGCMNLIEDVFGEDMNNEP